MNKKKLISDLENLTLLLDDVEAEDAINIIIRKIMELSENDLNESSPEVVELVIPSEVINHKNAYAIFSDGACRGNPGPGAWGTITQKQDGSVISRQSGVDLSTTNNRMELLGAIEGIDGLSKILMRQEASISNVFLYSDSKYLVDGMNSWILGWKKRGWRKGDNRPPENLDLWKRLDEIIDYFFKVNFIWVKGHAGHPQNELCDQMANEALDQVGF